MIEPTAARRLFVRRDHRDPTTAGDQLARDRIRRSDCIEQQHLTIRRRNRPRHPFPRTPRRRGHHIIHRTHPTSLTPPTPTYIRPITPSQSAVCTLEKQHPAFLNGHTADSPYEIGCMSVRGKEPNREEHPRTVPLSPTVHPFLTDIQPIIHPESAVCPLERMKRVSFSREG
ncbi:DUF601 domain-containing protein [Bifidobacterium ramosum]|uniref:DUF601 domain-containing protein n=1 Tax=Bifidobacterium ramosum TaxID=1798158 RepID=A0A7K3TAV9_9BIFI|nr:DUF601 domain-containing protein [Bifidobacterium ramosum]